MTINSIKDPRMASRFQELWAIVGNSPLLVISFRYNLQVRQICAKAEHFNITGSIKDRMALYTLQRGSG